MRPADLALLRTPGVPAVSPDGRIAVVSVSRLDLDADEYSQPAVGGAHRRLRPRPADHLRRPGHRPGLLARRALAGLSLRRARRPPAAARAAHRRRRRAPAHRPAPRRGRPGLGARLAADRVRRPRARAGPVRHRRGRRPGGRAAAADHHAEVPAGRRRLHRRPPQPGLRRRAAGRPGRTTRRRSPRPVQVTDGEAEDDDVAWSPDGAELAFVSARHDGADADLVRSTSTRSGPTAPGCAGSPPRASDCQHPAWSRDGAHDLPHRRPGPRPRRHRLRRAQRHPLPGAGGRGRRWRCCSTPRSTDRGDETPATVLADGGVLFGVQRRGAVELLRVPLRRRRAARRWSTGRSPCAGSRPRGGVVVATVAHDALRRRADRDHARRPAAAHRLRGGAGRHRPGAPDGGADGDRARRLPGARLDHRARRPGPAPGAAHRARRSVQPVRLDAVRRDADLRLGRATRSCSATRAGRPATGRRTAGRSRAAGAPSTPTTSSPSSTPRWRTRGWTPTGSASWAAPTAAT